MARFLVFILLLLLATNVLVTSSAPHVALTIQSVSSECEHNSLSSETSSCPDQGSHHHHHHFAGCSHSFVPLMVANYFILDSTDVILKPRVTQISFLLNSPFLEGPFQPPRVSLFI